MTFRILSYWNRIRADKEFPALTDVNISEIEEIYHFTFTIALGETEDEHMVQYFGPDLVSTFGQDYTGSPLIEAMNDTMINNTIGFYEKVIEARRPQSESSEFFMDGKEVKYRSIILPLSSDGEAIDYLFGTTNYKVFD